MPDLSLHILRDGQELGSLTAAEAREMVAAGFLRPSDGFWNDDRGKVLPLDTLLAAPMGGRPPLLMRAKSSVVTIGSVARKETAKLTRGVSALIKKPKDVVAASSSRALEDYLPKVRNLVSDHLAKTLRSAESALKDEEFLRKLFGAVYDCLPKPIYRFVGEASFVEFCLKHRNRLL